MVLPDAWLQHRRFFFCGAELTQHPVGNSPHGLGRPTHNLHGGYVYDWKDMDTTVGCSSVLHYLLCYCDVYTTVHSVCHHICTFRRFATTNSRPFHLVHPVECAGSAESAAPEDPLLLINSADLLSVSGNTCGTLM